MEGVDPSLGVSGTRATGAESPARSGFCMCDSDGEKTKPFAALRACFISFALSGAADLTRCHRVKCSP